MSLEPISSDSRVGMADLPPILFEGKRYRQVLNGEREGQAQRTGLMKVTDLDSGASTFVSIYNVPREPGLEADAGDVFFSSFELDELRREIRIENEHGQRYTYSIDRKVVSPAN